MEHQDDVDELKAKRICATCIGEAFLRDLVEKDGEVGECIYCEESRPSIDLDDLAGRIETAFKHHYSRTASEPDGFQYAMLKDKEIDYEWEREGEPTVYAIMNAADISEQVAEDIQAILADEHYDFDEAAMGEEGEFSSDTYYEEIMPGDEEWQEGWRLFVRTIKSESRFFSRTAAAQLGKLFDTIDTMMTRKGKPLVIDAGPGTDYTHLYRARVFQSDDKLEPAMKRPDKELAAPPPRFANAGRMNAKGISVFYGATSVDTALAEVRPPVGSQVAVAQFDIIRLLRLLDLTALSDVHESGSIFDTGYAYRLSRMMFLRKLSSRIAHPVMPDDQEFEYLPTQAVADFLATEGKVPLDGILFPSVQTNGAGLNVVLFHKASRCKELDIPDGTEIRAHTYMRSEDGPEPDYMVHEEVPPEKEKGKDNPFGPFEMAHLPWSDLSDYDDRPETLAVKADSMTVHIVNAVKFSTDNFEVRRHRSQKVDSGF